MHAIASFGQALRTALHWDKAQMDHHAKAPVACWLAIKHRGRPSGLGFLNVVDFPENWGRGLCTLYLFIVSNISK